MAGRLRIAAALTATVLGCLALTSPAEATLRSPRLADDCPNGYSYGERGFYALVVEGCAKEVDPEGNEGARVKYRGTVEVSGFLIEGSGDLIATTKRNGNGNEVGRIQRPSTGSKIVLDPRIGGQRRRVVLHTGAVDVRSQSNIPSHFYVDPPFDVQPIIVEGREIKGSAASRVRGAQTLVTRSSGKIDIPVNGGPSILGMRLRETIHDALAKRETRGSTTTGQIEVDLTLSLGQLVPAVFRDHTSRVKLTVVDGGDTHLDGLRLKLPNIAVPGIGGFKDLSIRYDEGTDLWSGKVKLELGDLFPTLDFEMAVRGGDGGVNYIRTEASNLGIPIGNSGVFLDSVRAAFNLDPLWFSAGAGVRAGPQVGGRSLITGNGDLRVDIEPRFRLEADARVEILPSGNGALATGSGGFILDSGGYLEVSANARFEVAIAGIGIGATIGGKGAYATDRNQFNLSAHAQGQLLLGFLGSIDVIRAKAVVSSDGWGTCTELNSLISAGVGQNWHQNVRLFTNCDLSPYRTVVRAPRAAQTPGSQTFKVGKGVKRIGVEVTASGPDPKVQLVSPRGVVVASSIQQGNRVEAGGKAAVIAQPGEASLLFGVANPAAGRWRVRWTAAGPPVTSVQVARDAPPVTASTTVTDKPGDRPGRRRIKVSKLKGLQTGEQAVIGVKTPTGIVPLGTAKGGGLDAKYDELEAGDREIVVTVLRDGVPLPDRTRTLKRYKERLSGPAEKIERKRKGSKLKLKAIARSGTDAPDAWQYVLSSKAGTFAVVKAKNGKSATVKLPNYQKRVRVTAQPIFHDRVLSSGAVSAPIG